MQEMIKLHVTFKSKVQSKKILAVAGPEGVKGVRLNPHPCPLF